MTGAALAERMRQFGHKSAEYVPSLGAGVEAITDAAEEGDMIITLGAGSVSQASEMILERLRPASEVHHA